MTPQPQLNTVLERNIAAMRQRRTDTLERRNPVARVVDHITGVAGSIAFVLVNAAILVVWILINTGAVPILRKFDETFVFLATAATIESFFLSTFILISQNRAAILERQHAELDVQISLLTEHEVTRLLHITTAIADHLGVDVPKEHEVEELKGDVAPDTVLDKLESVEH